MDLGKGECKPEDIFKPYFDLDEGGNLVQLPFQIHPQRKIIRSMFRHLKLYNWVSRNISLVPRLHYQFWRLGLVRHPYKEGQVPPHLARFDIFAKDYHPDVEKAWRITKALIKKIREESEGHGARFLLAIFGDAAQLVTAERIEGEYPGFKGVRYDLDKPDKILQTFALEEGINHFSLFPIFREDMRRNHRTVEDLHYSCDSGHWTPLGNRLATEAIFQKILADRLYQ